MCLIFTHFYILSNIYGLLKIKYTLNLAFTWSEVANFQAQTGFTHTPVSYTHLDVYKRQHTQYTRQQMILLVTRCQLRNETCMGQVRQSKAAEKTARFVEQENVL